jgi:choline transport protein
MSEEIQNPTLVVPRSIMTGILINGSMGFAMLVVILFRAGDLDAALAENPAFPFMAIFKHAVGDTSAAAAMSALVMIMAVTSMTGCLASCSRVFWAFSRDKGLPGWRVLSQVSFKSKSSAFSAHTVLD